MNNREAVNWLINISADIGKVEHSDLWHYERALTEIKDMLESIQPVATDTNVGNNSEITNSSDAVSRQAAIDAIDKRFDNIPMEQTAEILKLRKDLRELPSIQPETQWIPCSEMMPEEKDAGILKKLGTEKKVGVCPCYSRGQGRKNDRDSLYV